jgi:oligoendopeptidase F
MKHLTGVIMMGITFLLSAELSAGDLEVRRGQIADKYKWNLAQIYQTEAEWQSKKAELGGMIAKFDEYRGQLGGSAEILWQGLDYSSKAFKEYMRLSAYASMTSDQDTRESQPQAMEQEIQQIGTKLGAASSFIEPEILSLDTEKLNGFIKNYPRLAEYAHYIQDIQRRKAHTLSQSEEEIIAQTSLISGTANNIYGIFKDADMPRPDFTLPDGKTIKLDDAAFTLHRYNPDQSFRKKAFEEFFGGYRKFERTFGMELYSQVKKDLFYKNVRKYETCLQAALDENNIPESVYHSLIKGVHENLPTLHRYLKLRQRMMGLDQLHYYDLYPSLVGKVELSYTVEEAQELIKTAMKPLGKPYVAVLDDAFKNRWIDMLPNTGKRSGAYSAGSAYDVHPFILMNYNGKYEDVSTLAHELGHTMHSYFSNKNQTFSNSHYPIFLAEVASTLNEALLIDHVMKQIKDAQQRLAILGNQLESYRTTLFRQTMFAEFELKIHELAETGKALTGEDLSAIYLDLVRTYYGQEQGVTQIDSLYGIEWAYIPHFYYNFYVFQYATSLCASAAISEKILKEGDTMRDLYLTKFLSAGGSDYAIPILKSVGVDMTTSEPFNMAMKKMETIMDEMEKILNSK